MEAYTSLWREFEASMAKHVQADKQLTALLAVNAEPSDAGPHAAHQIRQQLVGSIGCGGGSGGSGALPTELSDALQSSNYAAAHHTALASPFVYDAKPLPSPTHHTHHTHHTETELETKFEQLRARCANTSDSACSIWNAACGIRAMTLAAPGPASGSPTQPRTLHDLVGAYMEAFEATKSRVSSPGAHFDSLAAQLERHLQQPGTTDVLEL